MASKISSYLVSQSKTPYNFIIKHVKEFPVLPAIILDRNLTTISGPKMILGFVVAF